jgi:hypothetical protein
VPTDISGVVAASANLVVRLRSVNNIVNNVSIMYSEHCALYF